MFELPSAKEQQHCNEKSWIRKIAFKPTNQSTKEQAKVVNRNDLPTHNDQHHRLHTAQLFYEQILLFPPTPPTILHSFIWTGQQTALVHFTLQNNPPTHWRLYAHFHLKKEGSAV